MTTVRAKVTSTVEGGLIRTRIDWHAVENEQLGEVVFSEEFAISVERANAGCAFVSRAEWTEGRSRPGTFWVDEEGRRHFYVSAEAGSFDLTGQAVGG